MGERWCKYEGDSVLLVEGQNDCHVTMALCERYRLPETFGIYACGSDNQALKRLTALIAGSSPPRIIGLMVDADSPNLAGRWSSIKSRLSDYNYEFPPTPTPAGTIINSKDGLPRLGFWLMPNNRIDGMLEDFCCEMISTPAIATVNQCLTIAEDAGHTSFKSTHRSKAVVHTYLAWQDEPGRPLGQAITAQVLKSDTSSAQDFVAWLRELFA